MPPAVRAPGEAPRPTQLEASTAWRCIDFISDLHLSAATPRTFAALQAYLHATPADAVFVLGDLFDAWVGDDARLDTSEPFEAAAAAMLHAASRRMHVAFMRGNRDFLVGSDLLAASGMHDLDDPTVLVAFGARVLLTHGDALCLDDTAYQDFRREVRGDAWRAAFLARPLAERRAVVHGIRQESERQKRARRSDAAWIDLDPIAACAWLHAAGAPRMIHGHTHAPACHDLGSGLERLVLSDWDLEAEQPRAEVLRWTATGLQRVAPEAVDLSPAPQ